MNTLEVIREIGQAEVKKILEDYAMSISYPREMDEDYDGEEYDIDEDTEEYDSIVVKSNKLNKVLSNLGFSKIKQEFFKNVEILNYYAKDEGNVDELLKLADLYEIAKATYDGFEDRLTIEYVNGVVLNIGYL